jgi:gamma-glutamyltranspeptidase / glutathione hydrolase / leukotriene-C4 hydrolase
MLNGFRATPGEIAGYWAAHKIAGKLPWKDLFEPIIEMCEKGFRMWKALAKAAEEKESEILEDPPLAAVLINKQTNKVYKENDTITMPLLAKTFREISLNPDSFYRGDLAKKIVEEVTGKGLRAFELELNIFKYLSDSSNILYKEE